MGNENGSGSVNGEGQQTRVLANDNGGVSAYVGSQWIRAVEEDLSDGERMAEEKTEKAERKLKKRKKSKKE